VLIIVAFVLLIFLPSPWDLVGFAVALVLFLVELLFWNRTVKRRRSPVGAETLIGREAVVSSACRPYGQVRLDGEIWAAHCEVGAGEGDTVRIVGRKRLTLEVEPNEVIRAG
jgi:membrane-bound serine protease (ClpP class)